MSEEQSALEPLEVRQVDFYGDEVIAALVQVGDKQQIYVPLRPICEYLGIDVQAQTRRIRRDEAMADALKGVAIMATPSANKRSSGGVQIVLAIDLEMLHGWLFTIDANRVRPELKEKIIRYRRECFRVLWQAFQSEALAVTKAKPLNLNEQTRVLVEVEKMGLAIAELAQRQLQFERTFTETLENANVTFNALVRRLGAVEEKLNIQPDYISPKQVATIQVKISELLKKKVTETDESDHWKVFIQFYQKFGITKVEELTKEQYQPAIIFLDGLIFGKNL